MINYAQWHTKKAPTSKKENSIQKVESLNAKVDMIMSILSTKNVSCIDIVPIGDLVDKNK